MEQLVYLHGVTGPREGGHERDYARLHDGISAQLERRGDPPLGPFADAITIEWGHPHAAAGPTGALAQAQEVIGDRVAAATPRDPTSFSRLPLAPAITPVRELLLYSWADLVYYVSEEGKRLVREAAWGRLLERADTSRPLDLTILAHSAGALIAMDLLFWLFSRDRDDEDPATMGVDASAFAGAREHWRVRRLVTLGSPSSALLVRSVEVTRRIADGSRLDARDLGLGRPAHDGHEPVWLNAWDRHDVLSHPVEPFWTGGAVKDLYADHSDWLLDAHTSYWGSRKIHRVLAEHWNDHP